MHTVKFQEYFIIVITYVYDKSGVVKQETPRSMAEEVIVLMNEKFFR